MFARRIGRHVFATVVLLTLRYAPCSAQGTYVGNIHLRSSNALYVSAEGGGGGFTIANRQLTLGWENFALYNQTRPSGLQDGDWFSLQVVNGEGSQLRTGEHRTKMNILDVRIVITIAL